MEYHKLGTSDLRVSQLCLGCMGFGDPARGQHSWTLDEARTRPILQKALELGINFFDTALAKAEGFPQFVSVQSHYNLIYREVERELLPLCREDGIALTPYSPLAGGRLARRGGVSTQRLEEDRYAKFKYDAAGALDRPVLERVEALAQARGVTMAQLSLAWLLHQGTTPVMGATKLSQLEDAVQAAALRLTPEELAYLEEPYFPHRLAGVMAQNTPPK